MPPFVSSQKGISHQSDRQAIFSFLIQVPLLLPKSRICRRGVNRKPTARRPPRAICRARKVVSGNQFLDLDDTFRFAYDKLEPGLSRAYEGFQCTLTNPDSFLHEAIAYLGRDVEAVDNTHHFDRWNNGTVGLDLDEEVQSLQVREQRRNEPLMEKWFATSDNKVTATVIREPLQYLAHTRLLIMNSCLSPALVQLRVLGVTPRAGKVAVVRTKENARCSRVYPLTLHAEEIFDTGRITSSCPCALNYLLLRNL